MIRTRTEAYEEELGDHPSDHYCRLCGGPWFRCDCEEGDE